MNFYTSSIRFQKDPSYKCQFCTKVHAPSMLVSEVWAKCKDVSIKILKRGARTNSSQHKKDFPMNSTNKVAKE